MENKSILDEDLEWEVELFSFTRYELADLSTSYEMDFLLRKFDIISKYYDCVQINYESHTTIIDYFFCKKYASYDDIFEHLLDTDNAKKIKKIIEYFKTKLKLYDLHKIITCIENNISTLDKYNNYSLEKEIADFVFLHNKLGMKIIRYYVDNKPRIVLNRIYQGCSDAINVINYNKDLKSKIVNLDTLKKYFKTPSGLDQCFDILNRYVHDQDPQIIKNISEIMKFLAEEADKYYTNILIVDKNWIVNDSGELLKRICIFFIRSKYKGKDKWTKYLNTLESKQNEYLVNYGEKIEATISKENQDQLIKILDENYRDILTNGPAKLLTFTHQIKENKSIAHWTIIGKSKQENSKFAMIDNILSKKDDYFFNSKLIWLDSNNSMYLGLLNKYYLQSSENINSFFNLILSLISFVLSKKDVSYNAKDIEDKIEMIKIVFCHALSNTKQNVEPKYNKGLHYCMMMLGCGMIEIILKLIYYVEFQEDYYDKRFVLLKDLLSTDSPICNDLGEDLTRIIKYYLINTEEGALNIRNKLAHLDFSHDDQFLSYGNCLLVLLILLTILNDYASKIALSGVKQ